jgi:hypothetical protein
MNTIKVAWYNLEKDHGAGVDTDTGKIIWLLHLKDKPRTRDLINYSETDLETVEFNGDLVPQGSVIFRG